MVFNCNYNSDYSTFRQPKFGKIIIIIYIYSTYMKMYLEFYLSNYNLWVWLHDISVSGLQKFLLYSFYGAHKSFHTWYSVCREWHRYTPGYPDPNPYSYPQNTLPMYQDMGTDRYGTCTDKLIGIHKIHKIFLIST